jgi:hypothetical protein
MSDFLLTLFAMTFSLLRQIRLIEGVARQLGS